MEKVESVHIPLLDEILKKMNKDPWYIKLKRWFHIKIWIWKCNTRFIWDLEYQHNIFKKYERNKI